MSASTAELLAALREIPVATLSDALGSAYVMAPDVTPVVPDTRIAGPAVTCYCPAGDNLPLHGALAATPPGAVLVVASHQRNGTGLWGELVTRSARARGIAGAIADGGVRDVAAIRDLRFPVWSRFVSPLAAGKITPHRTTGNPVTCGNVVVHDDDLIIADPDGVIVIPPDRAATVLAAATSRATREREITPQLEAGTLPIDLIGGTWPR